MSLRKVTSIIGTLLFFSCSMNGANAINLGGTNEMPWDLTAPGSVMESPCYLEMSSAWQNVELSTKKFSKTNNIYLQGYQTPFDITLHDCIRSNHQPYASLRIIAPTYANNSQLMKVKGESGVALRLQDLSGENLNLTNEIAPLNLVAGKSQLHFIVTSERIDAPLSYDFIHAELDFKLDYE